MPFKRYIHTLPRLTGNIPEDVKNLLCSNKREETCGHVFKVAEINGEIAARFGLDRKKCTAAGYLHDISSVISPENMLSYAKERDYTLCAAEETHPFLLHQRISADMAEEHFKITDNDILSAIKCHTTLKPDPTAYEMSLFISDKLAWDGGGAPPPFYGRVKNALDISLESACFEYMSFMDENGLILSPHDNWKAAYSYLLNKQESANSKTE